MKRFFDVVCLWRLDYEGWEGMYNEGYLNFDVVFNFGKCLRSICERFGISVYCMSKMGFYNFVRVELGEREISRRNLRFFVEFYERVVKEKRVEDVFEELFYLRELVEGDVFFDRIILVEFVYIDVVYGIINFEIENYIVEGFILKNSLISLELGIDIGIIDFVVFIGLLKSVNRVL